MKAKASSLTIVFGRFNPPTIGHERLIRKAIEIAGEGNLRIYPSRTQDTKKNPLDPNTKIEYMRKMLPDQRENIIDDPDIKTIFDVLVAADQEGVSEVNIVVGSDREEEFEEITKKYNDNLYSFGVIKVISAGLRDPDLEDESGISASKMRQAVANDNFAYFRCGTPKVLNDEETRAIFDAVRNGLGLAG